MAGFLNFVPLMQDLGKHLFLIGLVLLLLGLILWGAGARFAWFGDLPGDVRIEKENFRFYMPITSMILLSIFLSGILWLINQFLR